MMTLTFRLIVNARKTYGTNARGVAEKLSEQLFCFLDELCKNEVFEVGRSDFILDIDEFALIADSSRRKRQRRDRGLDDEVARLRRLCERSLELLERTDATATVSRHNRLSVLVSELRAACNGLPVRSAHPRDADDEREPDYGGALGADNQVHSDADPGL